MCSDPPDHRDGEASAQHFRAARTIQVNDRWFFCTREGIDVGPYSTRKAAELGAALLSTMLNGINDPEITRQFIREFMLLKK